MEKIIPDPNPADRDQHLDNTNRDIGAKSLVLTFEDKNLTSNFRETFADRKKNR